MSTDFTNQDARRLVKQASDNLDSAEKVFSENRFETASTLAQQAITLFEKALSLERQEKARQSIYLLASVFGLSIIVASSAFILYYKRKQQQIS